MGYTRDYPFKITREQYNYLLPIYGLASGNYKITERPEGCFFIGTRSEYLDLLDRCKYL